jgi:hypothetical protein
MNGAEDSQPRATAVSLRAMKRGIALTAVAAAFFIGTADAKPFNHSTSRFLDFEYGWSNEVSAVPALVKRFTADMNKQRASLAATAQSDAAERKKNGFPFNQYSAVTSIESAGQTARLLSLRIDGYEFTGGAHGNSGTSALLWDRRRVTEVKLATLARPGADFIAAFRTRYCQALDAERTKRRQGEKLGGDFGQCPKLSDLAIVPEDSNHNGRFDKLLFVAAPYIAGPYAEGEYEIGVPLRPLDVRKLKPEFQSSFGV